MGLGLLGRHNAVAPFLFGALKRGIGGADESLESPSVVREASYARRDRDMTDGAAPVMDLLIFGHVP